LSDERLKIAVFIDFDNIEIGVKTTLGTFFDIGPVLEAIKERGEIVTKIAYGDWTRAGDYGRSLSQHAVHMVQRNLTPGGDKNGADINLALDALEMAFTHNHINSFVIVSGDSDFISLVEKLKQYDRKVFVLGGRAFTSVVMQKNCTEFIAYENIVGRGRTADRARSSSESALSGAMPLVRRALKLLADREVLPQLGLLKSTLLQLDSAFSEREYGAGSFRDFVQKLAKAGYVTLKGSDRSFHVELREAGEVAAPASSPVSASAVASPVNGSSRGEPRVDADAAEIAAAAPSGPRFTPADACRLIQQAMAKAGSPRWPLYVRQMKQLIRAVDAQFDERRYGFGSLMEALKHCQREGVLRIERDRQGIIRVWPGTQAPPRTDAAGVEVLDAEVASGEWDGTHHGVSSAADGEDATAAAAQYAPHDPDHDPADVPGFHDEAGGTGDLPDGHPLEALDGEPRDAAGAGSLSDASSPPEEPAPVGRKRGRASAGASSRPRAPRAAKTTGPRPTRPRKRTKTEARGDDQ
jgi:uncharacterized LabA/DUF88 family protein